MIKSYGICLQRPESPCEQHFLGSNPVPLPLWPLYSLVHSRRCTVLHSLLPPPAKNWPGLCLWAGQKVQHRVVVVHAYTHMYVYTCLFCTKTSAFPFPFLFPVLILLFHLRTMHFAKVRMYQMHLIRREFSLQVLDYLMVRTFLKTALKVSYLFHN